MLHPLRRLAVRHVDISATWRQDLVDAVVEFEARGLPTGSTYQAVHGPCSGPQSSHMHNEVHREERNAAYTYKTQQLTA